MNIAIQIEQQRATIEQPTSKLKDNVCDATIDYLTPFQVMCAIIPGLRAIGILIGQMEYAQLMQEASRSDFYDMSQQEPEFHGLKLYRVDRKSHLEVFGVRV